MMSAFFVRAWSRNGTVHAVNANQAPIDIDAIDYSQWFQRWEGEVVDPEIYRVDAIVFGEFKEAGELFPKCTMVGAVLAVEGYEILRQETKLLEE